MSTTPIAATPISPAGTANTAPESSGSILGKDDFLKLMIAQLQAQNPLEPANGTEYVSELAQFTQLEQTTNLATGTERASAVQLIGRTVAYTNAAGQSNSGKVESIQSDSSGTTLTVQGVPGIKQSAVTEVL
ncbi:MAG TPA: flagellar hook capping FlgD N-terminal domain-containing protein [Solirubrobacteraceae bacterium]|jgi:flagellar basal-body rod modification protein FlgD